MSETNTIDKPLDVFVRLRNGKSKKGAAATMADAARTSWARSATESGHDPHPRTCKRRC